MKKNYKIFLAAGVLTAVLMSGCGNAAGENTESSVSEEKKSVSSSEKKSLPLPTVFEGMDMEGNRVSSSVFSDSKLTMINVWATYCNPCLKEMPDLGELAEEYEAADFQIIGIISDVQEGADQDALDLAAELIEQTGADYPHLLLNESLYSSLLTEVSAVPTTFFFNENGILLDTVIGSMEKSAWEEKINALLEEL